MSDSQWRDSFDYDWRDGGSIELKMPDGTIKRGQLSMDEGFNGEDDFTIPEVVGDNGEKLDWWSADSWRHPDRLSEK